MESESESCSVMSNPMDYTVRGFPKEEYWSGVPFPSPGDLPDSEIKPGSPASAGGFFTTELPGKPKSTVYN